MPVLLSCINFHLSVFPENFVFHFAKAGLGIFSVCFCFVGVLEGLGLHFINFGGFCLISPSIFSKIYVISFYSGVFDHLFQTLFLKFLHFYQPTVSGRLDGICFQAGCNG